jgi:hypothetical protein
MRYGGLKITRCSEDNIRIGKQGSTMETHGIMPHGTTPNYNGGVIWDFSRKSAITICSQLYFVWTKASLVAYDYKEYDTKGQS